MSEPIFATTQDFYDEAIKYSSISNMAIKLGISKSTVENYSRKLRKENFNLHSELLHIWKQKQSEYPLNDSVFDSFTNESVYWLGMLASDGYIHSKKNRISLCAQTIDNEHISAFKQFLNTSIRPYISNVITKGGKEASFMHLDISSSHIKEKLLELGFVPAKSNIDIDYLSYVPDEFKFAFIAGYFDGDGSINKNFKNFQIQIMGNKSLMEHMKRFLENIGIFSLVQTCNRPPYFIKYVLEIRKLESVKTFCEKYLELNEKYLLKRKRETVKDYVLNFHSGVFVCPECGGVKSSKAKMCNVCSLKHRRKCFRPSKEELETLIYTESFCAIARKYEVTDNAVRKWCKYYGLPCKVSKIKQLKQQGS